MGAFRRSPLRWARGAFAGACRRDRHRVELRPAGGVRRCGAKPGLFLQRKDPLRSGRRIFRDGSPEPRGARARDGGAETLRRAGRGNEGFTASDRGDGCGAGRKRRAGVPGRGAGGNGPGDPDRHRRRGGASVGAGRSVGLAGCGGVGVRHRRLVHGIGGASGRGRGGALPDLRSGAAEVDGAQGRQEGDARPYQGPRGGVGRGFSRSSEPPVPRGRVLARHRADRHGTAWLPSEGASRVPDDTQGHPRQHRDDRPRAISTRCGPRQAPVRSGCALSHWPPKS
jgi:hypothetical protein